MREKGDARLFWVVLLAAFALRAVHILLIRDNPLFSMPIMDAGIHDSWARGLLAGTWPPAEPFFRAPLYPYLLGGLYALFDAARLPVQMVHALISALGAGMAALVAARLCGRRAGWAAGLLLACAWTSIYFAGELLIVTLAVTLNLAGIWLLLDRPDEGRIGSARLFAAGLAFGLSAIARPNILIVLPAVAWYLWRSRALRPASARWLVLAAGLALPILPVTAHNVFKGGDGVLIATQGGVNFYIGNNPDSDGRTAIVPGTRATWLGGYRDAIDAAEREAGREMRPSEVDRHYMRKGLAFWVEDPLSALRLYARKLWLVLAAGERSNNKFIYCWREWSPLLRLPIWPGWALVLALSVIGFLRRDMPAAPRGLLLGFVGLYVVSLLLFFVNARFRLPVLAVLCIPAGAGIGALIDAAAARRWPPRIALASALAFVVGGASAMDYAWFRENKVDANPFHHYTLANAWAARGEPEAAIREFRESIRIQTRHPQRSFDLIADNLYAGLGELLVADGETGQALDVYSNWVRLHPGSLEGRLRLGDLLLSAGRVDEAAAQFEIALRAAPEDYRARLGYAWIQYHNGNTGAAYRAFRALDEGRGDPEPLFGQGLCLISQDRLAAAEKIFLQVLKRRPDYWQAVGNLAGIYERTGRIGLARKQYRRLLELQPGDSRARDWLARNGG